MQKALTKKEIKEIILKELPGLIKRDPKTREFILQLAQERFADKKKTEDRFEALLQEIKSLREEGEKRWQENLKRLERMEIEWNKKWEENEKRWQENQKVINQILNEIKLLHRKHDTSIGALGADGDFGLKGLLGML